MTSLRPLIAGNWKMNGSLSSLAEAKMVADSAGSLAADCLICPPFTLLDRMAQQLAGSAVAVGGQDCHSAASGAHTGDVSAAMLRDLGCTQVILGHSERRGDHGESSASVQAKAAAALAAGLVAIVCVGETEAQRDSGQTLAVVLDQLAASVPAGASATTLVIAYEPVWAIGTGRTPTAAEVAEVHAALRAALAARVPGGDQVRILYGGSVKPGNAAELLAIPHVNGALVGGASLKAADFLGILRALP
jgi:triosephosphate isomerase (TIM)